MVLIKVDTFTIFDTMESMKGHKEHRKPRRAIQSELTKCNTTPFLTDFVCFFVIALGGTNLKTTDPGSGITTPSSIVKQIHGDYL